MAVNLLFRLFGESPFGPIVEHAKIVTRCVGLLEPLTDAWLRGDREEIHELHNQVSSTEHEADELKHQIRQNMPKSMFFPVPRGDLLRIVNQQDNMADSCEDYAVLLRLRKTSIPQELHDDVRSFVELITQTANEILDATDGLDVLLEVSFSGSEADRILEKVAQVEMLEWETDKASRHLVETLLEREKEIPPLDVVFVLKIMDALSGVANHAENCADNLRNLILTRS